MKLTSAAVLKVIEMFDAMGAEEFFQYFSRVSGRKIQRADSYFIRHEGQEYDMKAVVRVARGQILGVEAIHGPLDKPDVVKRWLEALGFHIAHHDEAYPRASQEGGKKWVEQERSERDPRLAREAKELNRKENGGRIKCEACGFEDKNPAMFDAHHKHPLKAGKRMTRVNELAVLCPTCHRWSHQKADDRLYPLTVEQIRRERRLKGTQPRPS